MNIADAPIFKIEDRRALAQRVFDHLFADPSAVLDFKGGWKKPTPDEIGNWAARQHFARLLYDMQPKTSPLLDNTVPVEGAPLPAE
jgi:hypothetical protein